MKICRKCHKKMVYLQMLTDPSNFGYYQLYCINNCPQTAKYKQYPVTIRPDQYKRFVDVLNKKNI